MKNILKNYQYIKSAIILKNPIDTAYGIIYKEFFEKENINIEIFSTEEYAFKWIIG